MRLYQAPGFVLLLALALASPAIARDLTFEERVQAQEAIERVYYSHQIGVTRLFEEAVPRAILEKKVEAYLKQNAALESIWKTSITTEMLRRELTRMSEETRMPERLRDLYRALGNSSFLIEECLARPVLVDRLTRSFYAFDQVIHSGARADSESLRRALLDRRVDPFHDHPSRAIVDFVRANSARSKGDRRGRIGTLSSGRSARMELQPEEFDRFSTRLPSQPGDVGDLEEESDTFVISVTLKADATAIKVATYTVPKRSWDDWWSEAEGSLPVDSIRAVASRDDLLPDPIGGSPNVADIQVGATGADSADAAASTCATGDTWDNGSLGDIPYPRHSHTAVWTGSVMIIWGGSGYGLNPGGGVISGALSEGWRYDPAIDRWSLISSIGAPRPRYDHTAIWTGTEMIVWGGYPDDNPGSGGRYDPISNTWRAVSSHNAPPGTRFATAVWTGTQMVVWGGYDFYLSYSSGGRYDPRTDTWLPISSTNAPSGRYAHTAVWTGSQMLVWGGSRGSQALASGGRYDPVSDTWNTISMVGAPSARYSHTAAWSGELMVVWGGVDNIYGFGVNTGGRYDPWTDTWTSLSTLHVPSERLDQTVVWTGSRMLIWGGSFSTSSRFNVNGGGAYDPISDAWSTISTTNAPQARGFHSAIWTGTLMVIWGGVGYGQDVSSGGRYDPSTDTWTPTSATNAPSARERHTAVWTGNLMIVWGGFSHDPFGYLQTGGRYDPVTDTWAPTSTTATPSARYGHSAVWTGTSMVVWGGSDDVQILGSGGQYDPISDVWVPTSLENAPIPRVEHTAIWTGNQMIIWGGIGFDGYSSSGGRYDPLTDGWTSTNETGAPSLRTGHTAVWTGSSMIVWGGCDSFTCPKTGAMYHPETDIWSMISTSNAPVGRLYHAAVWTGSAMIVWGGVSNILENTGGRYDPSTDSWLPTSTVLAPIGRQGFTAVWTGMHMVIWGGFVAKSGGQYDPIKDDWVPTSLVNAPPNGRGNHSAVWTGAFMIIWGGATNGPFALNTGGRYCACAVKSYYRDVDGDGYGSSDLSAQSCSIPSGYVSNADDCDDSNSGIHPGAPEACNSLDDNCDGRIDEGFGVGVACTAPVDSCHQVVGELACRTDGTGTECKGPLSLHDMTPPAITCPVGSTLECPATSAGIGQASATDACDPAPSVKSDAPARLPLGSSIVTWTAADASGNASTCEQTVVVVDTTLPSLLCPAVSTAECTGPAGASVALLATASDACSSTVQIQNDHTPNGADGSGIYPLGTTSVVFKATDGSGNVATCEVPVRVQDTTPPVLAAVADLPTLWPPNHRMVTVQAALQVSDICDPVAGALLVSVTSTEEDDAAGSGDGNTSGDIQDASIGTPDTSVVLRAERLADGPGRVYTLTYTATDASGNRASALGLATVPHDLGTGPEPVSLGLEPDGAPGMAHLYWNAVSGAEMYDVIEGDLSQVKVQDGEIRLGLVHVLASGQGGTSYSEDLSAALPPAGRAFFYLVQYRTGLTASGWGTESSPWPAVPTSCDVSCPGEVIGTSLASREIRRR